MFVSVTYVQISPFQRVLFQHTEDCFCRTLEKWKKKKSSRKAWNFPIIWRMICGVSALGREGRRKEGRKEGRGGWSLGKNLEQESGCSVVNTLCTLRHVHYLFPICPIFIIPYQLTRLLVRLKGNRNSHRPLTSMSTNTLEGNLAVFHNTENTHIHWPRNSTSRNFWQFFSYSKEYVHKYVVQYYL